MAEIAEATEDRSQMTDEEEEKLRTVYPDAGATKSCHQRPAAVDDRLCGVY